MEHVATRFLPTDPLVLVLGLITLSGVAASGQEGAMRPDGVFVETVEVEVVNLEVFVTDADGTRVTGLGKDDFEVFEDGRPMEITNFYAVADRRRLQRERQQTAVGQDPTAEPRPDGPAAPVGSEPDHSLRLVVYIDNDNVDPLNRNRFFAHLRRFIHQNLIAGDQIAIYTYERALHLRQAFTSNIAQALERLDEIERLSGRGMSKADERRDLLREIDRATSRLDVDAAVRIFARSTATDLDFTIDALGEMVTSLAGLPGRKMVLYISDGLPMRPAEDLFAAMAERFDDPSIITEAFTYDAARRFQELTARANANQVTFYSISAAGLRAHGGAGADVSLSQSYMHLNNVRRLNFEAPLKTLALETGGLPIVGTSNFDGGLERVAEDFGGYYSLGYAPAHGGDGRYYEVEVRVTRPGLTARHRQGYRAKTPRVRMAERTLTVLANKELARNPLEIAIELDPPSRGENRLWAQPLRVRVPIRKVTLLPRESVHVGSLKLFLAALDDEGRIASIDDQPWPIEIPGDRLSEAMSMTLAHEVTLTMRPGFHRIAVGLRDELSAEESFVTRDLFLGGS